MLRNLKPGGFWRRARARLLLRSPSLSSYPWPMQFKPRFVFAVLLTRAQRPQPMQERAKSAGRRRGHKALQRQAQPTGNVTRRLADGARPRAAFARESMSAPALASIRVFKTTQIVAARAAAGSTTARRAAWRPSARATRPVQAGVARRARHEGSRLRPRRQASTRFVAQRALAVLNPAPAARWPVGAREAPVRRVAVWERTRPAPATGTARKGRLPVWSAHPDLVSVIERHVHVEHRRAMTAAGQRVGADSLRSLRPFAPSASASREAPRFRGRERAGVAARSSSADPLRERVRTVETVRACWPGPAAVVKRAQRAVRSGALSPTAAPRRVRVSVTRPARTVHGSRRADGNAATFARNRIRHTGSARRQRFVFARQRPQQRGGDRERLRTRERFAERLPLVLRQRAMTAGLREPQQVSPRQAVVMRESRRNVPQSPSEPSAVQSKPAPVVEEVRRILIPLLQETLFSQGTMGRLANGVVTEVDRRDSAEQYRKSGGR